MNSRKPDSSRKKKPSGRVSFYPGWCKRCGNCVEFCHTGALEMDPSGYPRLAHPEKCVSCHLCEKLCPDFAITVGDERPKSDAERSAAGKPRGMLGSLVTRNQSPERLAQTPEAEEDRRE